MAGIMKIRVLFLAGLVSPFVLLSCESAQRAQVSDEPLVARDPAQFVYPEAYHMQEVIPPGERAAIDATNQAMIEFFARAYGKNPREGKRIVHPKTHGCVKANFATRPELPEWIRQGIFQPRMVYPTIVRFSNAFPTPQSDAEPDSRGFGMQVLNVAGSRLLDSSEDQSGTQDFTMNSFPSFFAADAQQYQRFLSSALRTGGFTEYMLSEFRNQFTAAPALAIAGIGFVKTSNPLGQTYYSISPFTHGEGRNAILVKHAVAPCGGNWQEPFDKNDPNFMTKLLQKHLQSKNACFKFLIQRQTNPQTQPVENLLVKWKENEAPFIEVGAITIQPQALLPADQCERLVINPWKGLAAHRPVGGVNRLRKTNYQLSVQMRKNLARPTVDGSAR